MERDGIFRLYDTPYQYLNDDQYGNLDGDDGGDNDQEENEDNPISQENDDNPISTTGPQHENTAETKRILSVNLIYGKHH